MKVETDVVTRILGYARRVAVVGLSDDPTRPSYGVARALLDLGYQIVPVNPTVSSALGLKAYARVRDIPGQIDVVDVFRRPEFLAEAATDAAAAGARALWLQAGLVSPEARRIARAAGLDYVEDRCLKVDAFQHLAQTRLTASNVSA